MAEMGRSADDKVNEMLGRAHAARSAAAQHVADAAAEAAAEALRRVQAANPGPSNAAAAATKSAEDTIKRNAAAAAAAAAKTTSGAGANASDSALQRIQKHKAPGGGKGPNDVDPGVLKALKQNQFMMFQLTAGAQDIAAVLQNGGSFYQAINGAANNLGVLASMAGPAAATFGTIGIIALPIFIKAVETAADKMFFSAAKAGELAAAHLKLYDSELKMTELFIKLEEAMNGFKNSLEEQAKAIEDTAAKEVAADAFTDEEEFAIRDRERTRLVDESTGQLQTDLNNLMGLFDEQKSNLQERGWLTDFLTQFTTKITGADYSKQEEDEVAKGIKSTLIKSGFGILIDKFVESTGATSSAIAGISADQARMQKEYLDRITKQADIADTKVRDMSPEDFIDVVAARGTDEEKKKLGDTAAAREKEMQDRATALKDIEDKKKELEGLEEKRARASNQTAQKILEKHMTDLKAAIDKLAESMPKELGKEQLDEQKRTNKVLEDLKDLQKKMKGVQ